MCFAKGQTVFHGGGEYGKEAARFLANNLGRLEVLALIRSGTKEEVERQLGTQVALREVSDGPMRELPEDLNDKGNVLFLPLPGKFLKAQGPKHVHPRVIAVEHGLMPYNMAYGVSDRICHPMLAGFWHRLICGYAGYRRRKRVRWATQKAGPRYGALGKNDKMVAASRYALYDVFLNQELLGMNKGDKFWDTMEILPPLSAFSHEEAEPFEGPREGVLLLGANRLVKNAERFLEGLARHPSVAKLVNQEGVHLVGADGKTKARFQRRFGRVLDLHFHPYIEPRRVQTVIGTSKVLAYPSLIEGFGIPPVEGFKWGTPVLATSANSVPEVVGGAAMLADPLDASDMANKVTQLIRDPAVWNEKSQKGRARYQELKSDAYARWKDFAKAIEEE